jgi:hypothetical protein
VTEQKRNLVMISFVFVSIGLFIVLIGWAISEKLKYESFKKRFPAISDAEFIARCNPGTDPEVALRVRRIVADSLGIEEERIYPSSRFAGDLD